MKTSGELVAATLSGSWRKRPHGPDISPDELAQITPLLLQSGAGALTWWRLRDSPLSLEPTSAEFHQAYRLHAIQSAVHETNLQQVLKVLRQGGIEPILVKGWAIARLYPETGLRPYGDFDLCVNAAQYVDARATLLKSELHCPVDLHKGTDLLDDRSWSEIFERSKLVTLNETDVRVPSAEDHFRLLCFHLLRHGVERPIGLCDIAVALESRGPDFDWKTCLGTNHKHADWIACVIGLAQELLTADVGEFPFSIKRNYPAWILKSVLKAWGQDFSAHFSKAAPLEFYRQHPRGLASALRARWPAPIVGTVGVGGSFNRFPRFPYQFGYLLVRSLRFLRQVS